MVDLNFGGIIETVITRDEFSIEKARNILKDETTPQVIRMYSAMDYLYVETNEESDCVYGTSSSIACSYNFSDGSEMVGTLQFIHSAPWQLGHLYYIKCKDKWDNYPGGREDAPICTIIISPYEVPTMY